MTGSSRWLNKRFPINTLPQQKFSIHPQNGKKKKKPLLCFRIQSGTCKTLVEPKILKGHSEKAGLCQDGRIATMVLTAILEAAPYPRGINHMLHLVLVLIPTPFAKGPGRNITQPCFG